MRRYLLGFTATIGLIILLIFLIFSGGSKSKVPSTSKSLDSYAVTNAEVEMTIDGPVNSDQNHQSIKITVSNSFVTYQQIQGFQGNVVKLLSFPNNVNAYTNFLYSLEHTGYTLGDNSSKLKNELGYCPLGDRFIFKLNQDGQVLERYWATSCGKPKTYKGNLNLTLTLFKAQVPGYSDLISKLNL